MRIVSDRYLLAKHEHYSHFAHPARAPCAYPPNQSAHPCTLQTRPTLFSLTTLNSTVANPETYPSMQSTMSSPWPPSYRRDSVHSDTVGVSRTMLALETQGNLLRWSPAREVHAILASLFSELVLILSAQLQLHSVHDLPRTQPHAHPFVLTHPSPSSHRYCVDFSAFHWGHFFFLHVLDIRPNHI